MASVDGVKFATAKEFEEWWWKKAHLDKKSIDGVGGIWWKSVSCQCGDPRCTGWRMEWVWEPNASK